MTVIEEESAFGVGDVVEYRVGKAIAVGTVVQELTEDTDLFKGYTIHCTKDNPYYLIMNDHTKKEHWYHKSQILDKLSTALSAMEEEQEEEEAGPVEAATRLPYSINDKVIYRIGKVTANGTIIDVIYICTMISFHNFI